MEESSGKSFTAFPSTELYENQLPKLYAKNRSIYTQENISVKDIEAAIRDMFVKIAIFLKVNGRFSGQRASMQDIVDPLIKAPQTSTIEALKQTFRRGSLTQPKAQVSTWKQPCHCWHRANIN